ncbi:MAG: efflux RND transporter periplasmic adaptor subunit [Ignavibacteria bacterium]
MKNIRLIIVTLTLSATVLFFNEGCSTKKERVQTVADTPKHKDIYHCPMHPQVTSDKPGVCPICSMELVKTADDQQTAPAPDMNAMLSLSRRGEMLANVGTVKAKKENIIKRINAFGYLDFAEQGRRQITARFNGRIEKLYVNAAGMNIQKGQALFDIYSPDLVQAQNEFLIALKSDARKAQMPESENLMLSSSRKKLELLGITEKQISELEASREVKLAITYHSPYSGTVIEKKVQEGMYVTEGSSMFDIADMSILWNISEINSADINLVKMGDDIKMKTQAFAGEEFSGRVTLIYPVVDAETRTIKVRSGIHNTQGKLKPQMYTETIFERNYGAGITVPERAILFTGKRNIVWVKTGDGMYDPRDVTIGIKTNGNYQILSGLKEGEEVASSGGYLIDSESQLKDGAAK